ncbi:transmembrane prolyl 4-hydroxylase-like isoform X3 [Xenia sp. Carnegie-2017]|uniref:transmembrane prolyl 4-hydroxylase-like isoform X3 n=1 Tax=Xenia sp. Carnegie-2017 TaxID=2897299 RepID=UPI001F0414FF|nr:transmembrane prolyl 4-hydroxylase-like isoform X3 [Xenia sp. Carnegie-2017]
MSLFSCKKQACVFLLVCVVSSVFVECSRYTKDVSHSCIGEFCVAKSAFDEPCMDYRKVTKNIERDIDNEEEEDHDFIDYPKEGLFRWDPVEIGHKRELELEADKFYSMITRAMEPPIFEIPGFLSDEECDGIIDRTRKQGLFNSDVHVDPDAREQEKKIKRLIGHADSPAGNFLVWDDNRDGVISKDELKSFAAESKFLYMSDEEVDEMIEKMELTEFDDGIVTIEEFKTLRTAAMEKYFLEMKKTHPKHRDRYSQQTWLPQRGNYDKLLRQIRQRVANLTKLPMSIIKGGEHLQVVHYNINGHYHAHYDSQSNVQFPQYKCCHQNLDKLPECRLCRYITILYYLNQPEIGGETAFVAADVDDFNETEFRKREKGDHYNLSKFCHQATLVIPPKRGTAIMWYNHHLSASGWLGDLDWKTLHGGCDILKGEKWLANNWLTAPNEE